jgi:UDP-3-O-[3-hydroxymyristoyl] N-acetylglucosamine deacetylase/3-hydroxyacyl-[acyl-carrier-protein] dehydratase
MADKQKTIKSPVSINGKGLHTGVICNITFKSAPCNHGYKFQRIDLEDKPIIDALVDNVVDTSRGTSIESNGVRINTVEHALSAIYGLGIDNILIEIDGPEVPILGGSAIKFADLILKSGIIDQEEDRDYFEITSNISYSEEENGIEFIAVKDEFYSMNVLIDYDSTVLTNQYASINSMNDYYNDIAKARTFVFLHELEALVSQNLIKGGDLNNAIVIVDKEVTQETLNKLATFFEQPKVDVIPQKGVLNNIDLFYYNEPARHKLLDLIGDLALLGIRLKGRVFARRPGHRVNIEFAKKIKKIIKKERSSNSAPRINLNAEPVLCTTDIFKILPHRPPFLLVDKVMHLDEKTIIGVKNITMNEPFFVGHFPGEPVMPGVLQIEAMAQTGGILVLNSVPDPENYLTFFMKIDNAKFKRKVFPGDTLVFKCELTGPIRRGIASMKARAFVGDNIVSEAELMAQISKIK